MNKKLAIALLTLVVLSLFIIPALFIPIPAHAENVTCNVTCNVTAYDPDWDFGAYTQEIKDQMGLGILSFIVLGLASLAFWRREFLLYLIASLALIIFGLYFTGTNMGIGIMVAILGGYCLWKAVEKQLGRA